MKYNTDEPRFKRESMNSGGTKQYAGTDMQQWKSKYSVPIGRP